MTAPTPQNTVLVIGGSGAQGIPIVEALSRDPKYTIRVLTRSPTSDTAKQLLQLPNVSLIEGDPSSEPSLQHAFTGISHVFVNTNSFALGIRTEIYWGTRIFEIAAASGVQHYIWSALEDASLLSNYDPSCRVGHYEGKSRVTQWMKSRPQTPMKWSVLTTGPYVEMLHELLRPEKEVSAAGEEEEEFVFRFPLKDGAIPFVSLTDIGVAVKWMFDHPEEAAGLNLKTSIEHASGASIAAAFTAVTGKKARYEDITTDAWLETGGPGPRDHKIGSRHPGNNADDPTGQTVGENFGNWWNLYQKSAGNAGLLRTDYEVLDRLFPGRVRSVEEWMRGVGYTGEKRSVVKNYNGR